MPGPIIVDAGPLVALSHPRDQRRDECERALRLLPAGAAAITTLAAVTEAMYLLANVPNGRTYLFDLLLSSWLTVDPFPASALPHVRDLMRRYDDLPMDFADATLVELAERLRADTIFTLDERDFRVYRPRHVGHFRLLPADL
jgi:predicted nucleic acid-binding protein